jgi:hypothetical protein
METGGEFWCDSRFMQAFLLFRGAAVVLTVVTVRAQTYSLFGLDGSLGTMLSRKATAHGAFLLRHGGGRVGAGRAPHYLQSRARCYEPGNIDYSLGSCKGGTGLQKCGRGFGRAQPTKSDLWGGGLK